MVEVVYHGRLRGGGFEESGKRRSGGNRPSPIYGEWTCTTEGGDLGLDGYFTTSGGRILAPKVPIGRLGL